MESYNYEKDLDIDKHSLDLQWVSQPRLYMNYAMKAENADAEYRKAKENLEIVYAQVYQEERSRLEKEGKVTEALISSAVAVNEKHIKAKKEVESKLYESGIYKAATRAFEQKKKALENLVQLYLAGYWSAPQQNSEKVRKNIRGKKNEK